MVKVDRVNRLFLCRDRDSDVIKYIPKFLGTGHMPLPMAPV